MTEPNFLQKYQALNSGTEIPPEFALWCGISGVAAMLSRKVWVDMGRWIAYPNFYIVLVAGSGRCRKSTAIGLIEGLLQQCEEPPNLISQMITPEALIQALQPPVVPGDTRILSPQCEGIAIVDEMTTFLNRKSHDAGLGNLLLALFDCKDSFQYRTKGGGVEDVTNAWFGTLMGTTPELIKKEIPPEVVGAGLTSRMLFAYVDTPEPPVAMTVYTEDERRLRDVLIRELGEFKKVQPGPMRLSPDGERFYVEWYNRFSIETPLYHNPLLTGYASRRHVHMLKLATILSMVESREKVIESRHLIGGDELLTGLEKNLPVIIQMIASTEKGSDTDRVLKIIQKSGEISRSELMRKVKHRHDAQELSLIIDTLAASEQIQLRATSNGALVYTAPI